MTRRHYSDTLVGLSFEWHVATVRFFPLLFDGARPRATAACAAVRLNGEIVKIGGIRGELSHRHCALLVRSLHAEGFRVLYADPLSGRLPMGERIAVGDFEGWHRIDLVEATKTAQKRYPDDDISVTEGADEPS